MTPNTERQEKQKDENARQGASTTVGASTSASGESNKASNRADRERSIETGRDSSRRSSMTARQNTTPAFGLNASPFSLMRRMAEDMDRLFFDFGFGRSAFPIAPAFDSGLEPDMWRGTPLSEASWSPQVETFQRAGKLIVRADLPGLRREDVHVEVDDGMLTIAGERHEENVDDRGDFYRSERSYGRFYRAIPLPEGVDGEQCDASFKDGTLEVTLSAPKRPDKKAKQIQIRGG